MLGVADLRNLMHKAYYQKIMQRFQNDQRHHMPYAYLILILIFIFLRTNSIIITTATILILITWFESIQLFFLSFRFEFLVNIWSGVESTDSQTKKRQN